MRCLRLAVLGMAGIAASCGGGGAEQLKEALSPEILLTQPSQIVQLVETGKQPGDTSLTLRFRVTFEDFFRCGGHAGVMLHAALERIPSAQYRGVGLVFGRFGSAGYTTRNLPNWTPVAVLETWDDSAATFDRILAATQLSPLRDWTPYDVEVRSRPTSAGNIIGYTWREAGRVLIDIDAIDVNPAVDMGRQELAFFNATDHGVATCTYAVRITNLQAIWTGAAHG